MTEHEIDMTLAHNVDLIYDRRCFAEESPYSGEELHAAAVLLTQLVKDEQLSLRRAGLECERRLGFTDPGTGLAIIYYLIANRYWNIDMFARIDPGKSAQIRSVNLEPTQNRLSLQKQRPLSLLV